MTPKQILDSFSETLVRDERILSAQERILVSTLLQHAKTASGSSSETQEAVRAVVASAVGEVVAQRAFAVLGGSIVERILEGSALATDVTAERSTEVLGPGDPQTPTRAPLRPSDPQTPSHKSPKDPQTPSHKPLHTEPQTPTRTPLKGPGDPQTPTRAPLKSPGDPQTPTRTPLKAPGDPQTPTRGVVTTVVSEASVAVADRPENLPARCVVLDEFLAPQELEALTRFTLARENDFQVSEVLSPHAEGGVVNYDHRRSRLLMDLERHEDVMLQRIKSVLPEVLKKLDMEQFEIRGVEAQITASNDGDFFRFHCDNASDVVASRHLTFVYFFHREPRLFEGGELRIHDSRLEDGHYESQGSYQTIVPQQNQIVFFPCELMHEITTVKCPSRHFADSRFTMNGWLRQ